MKIKKMRKREKKIQKKKRRRNKEIGEKEGVRKGKNRK